MQEQEGLAFQAPQFPERAVPPPLTEEPLEVQTVPSPGPEADGQSPPTPSPEAPGRARTHSFCRPVYSSMSTALRVCRPRQFSMCLWEEKRGQVSGGATERRWLESQRNLGAVPMWVRHLPGRFQSQDAPGGQAESMPTHPPWIRLSHRWPQSAGR